MHQMIFIDFEASSLSADSWPIELGICWIDEQNKLRVEAKLIQPHASWQLSEWSEFSQKIHGITLDELEAPPSEVIISGDHNDKQYIA